MKFIVLFVSLAVLWLLLSGLTMPLMLALGLGSCALVVWLVKRFDGLDKETVPVHIGWGIFSYWGWLVKEIVVSSIQVTKIVLSPKMAISPQLVKVKSLNNDQVGRVIFGNSITMTPGTITLDIDDDGVVTVHALTRDGADGVLNSDMNDRVAQLNNAKA
jgi:multicomponent Na+:H+ antiporter subunit E